MDDMSHATPAAADDLVVRPMRDGDLGEALRAFRLAFGTFVGLPDPSAFGGDSDFVRPRFAASPESAHVPQGCNLEIVTRSRRPMPWSGRGVQAG